MKVAKWGNSLAVRLPASLVVELGLKEGDEIELIASGNRRFDLSRDRSREEAREEIKRLRKPLPPDYVFNREELYERGDPEPGSAARPGAAAD